jgi:hypothetical protein
VIQQGFLFQAFVYLAAAVILAGFGAFGSILGRVRSAAAPGARRRSPV